MLGGGIMERLIDYIRRYLIEHQTEYEEWLKEKGGCHENKS